MARPTVIPDIRHKRGNLNWGCPIPPVPILVTEFELQVRQLCLTADAYAASTELRRWCWENRNRFYIPEWLLEKWHITDPNLAA
jgi:hypothetical protein